MSGKEKVDIYQDEKAFAVDGDEISNGELVNQDEDAKYSHLPMRVVQVGSLKFNPVSSLIGTVGLWGLALFCMTSPEYANTQLSSLMGVIVKKYGFLYIGLAPFYLGFVLYLYFKYGHIKLGDADGKPEFSNVTYFSMIFSAGIGIGVFYFGCSEPLYHKSSTRFSALDYRGEDEIDLYAINQTVFHWSLAGWVTYTVIAISASLATYRFGLPLTFRSCLHAILGDYTWGWIGDVIDGFAVITTVAGVCTSLGLGVFQIVGGLEITGIIEPIGEDDTKRQTLTYIITIWAITGIATLSVLSGLNTGIKRLSQLAFGLGIFLWLSIFLLGNTPYFSNLMVSEIGYFFQHIPSLMFQTDTFGNLEVGEGRAMDGQSAATWWQSSWSGFYQAWWVSWACFVSIFIARVSKNRTIAQVVHFTLPVPLFYAIAWISVLGGAGIMSQRKSNELIKLGLDFHNNSDYYKIEGTVCYNIPDEPYFTDGEGTVVYTTEPYIDRVCQFDSSNVDQTYFNVLYQFSGFGNLLSYVSIATIAIYFITSSDSGSLIVDHLASNGSKNHHPVQKIYWAFTEGGLASALLFAGGNKSLKALQAASIVSAFPFCLILILNLLSCKKMCEKLEHEVTKQRSFDIPVYGGVFNVMDRVFSFGMVNTQRAESMPLPTAKQTSIFFISIAAPFLPIFSILTRIHRDQSGKAILILTTTIFSALFYYGFVAFLFTSFALVEIDALSFGTILYIAFALTLSTIRHQVRRMFNIGGNMIEDFLACFFLFPNVLVQCSNFLTDENLESPHIQPEEDADVNKVL